MAQITWHGTPVDPEDILKSGFQGNRNSGFLKNIINTTAGVPNAVYSSNKADFTKGYGNKIPILTASNAARLPSMSTLPTGGAVTGYEYLQSPAQASKGQRILADVMANKWPNSAKANFLKGQINNPPQSKVHLKNVNLNALDKVVHPNKYLNLTNMGNNPIVKNLMKVAKIPGAGLPLAFLSELDFTKANWNDPTNLFNLMPEYKYDEVLGDIIKVDKQAEQPIIPPPTAAPVVPTYNPPQGPAGYTRPTRSPAQQAATVDRKAKSMGVASPIRYNSGTKYGFGL